MKRITIKDIAGELNISVGTVDRAMHGRGRINEETRRQVIQKANELGYRPNKLASILVKNTTIRFAFITPAFNEFFEEIIKGAKSAAYELMDFGVQVDFITQPTFYDSLGQINAINDLIFQKPDGIIVVPLHSLLLSVPINGAVDHGIPVVVANLDTAESKRICYIGQDPYKTGAIIGTLFGKFLINGGYIAVLEGITETATLQRRTSGFLDKINEKYNKVKVIGRYEYSEDIKTAYAVAKKLIENRPDIDGIFANTAYGSIGVGQVIKDLNRCGEIVSVGFDTFYGILDLLDCGALNAIVTQDPFIQGYYAVKVLYKLVAENKTPESEFYYTRADVIVSSEQHKLIEEASFRELEREHFSIM